MPKKQQPHPWILTSVAAFLLLAFSLLQLDSNKFNHALKAQFLQSGIQLQAASIRLSWMYLGSVRLDDVAIKSDGFELTAQRLFIDLDLAALLTGKAIAQAFYLQFADITILQTTQDAWLKSFVSDHFKLKRINISQSEIHFSEQHLTLEQADLDIRNIGQNKSPRLELIAHVGDGRIDAHGYLHLRQGEITRGFARLRLHDIPLLFIQDYALSSTLNGSITTHINQDETWQSFGHLSVQKQHKNILELRGKITGDPQQWVTMDAMVLTIPDAGALALSGECADIDTCKLSINSSNFKLAPIFHFFAQTDPPQISSASSLRNIDVHSTWQNGVLSSDGKVDWQALDIRNASNDIQLQAGSFSFSGLQYKAQQAWQLEQARLSEDHQPNASLHLQGSHNAQQHLKLALSFKNTPLWLQLNQALTIFSPNLPNIHGKGHLDGDLNLEFVQKSLKNIQFKLDASSAELKWQQAFKPSDLPLLVQGNMTLQAEQDIQSLHITTSLADQYASIRYANNTWHAKALDLNLNTLRQQGVRLPHTLQAWHGHIKGEASLANEGAKKLHIKSAKLDFNHFGFKQDLFNGHVQKTAAKWNIDDLNWQHGQHTALISLHQRGKFTLSADQLDSKALFIMQALPFLRQGSIHSQKFNSPFGTLHHFSSQYHAQHDSVLLKKVNSKLGKGSFRAKKLQFKQHGQNIHVQGSVQLGDVQLKRWTWLTSQLHTKLRGKLYATMNIQADMDAKHQLSTWTGDGKLSIYNGKWLQGGKKLQTEQFHMAFRQRQRFTSTFQSQSGKHNKGHGKLEVDSHGFASGQYHKQGNTFNLGKTWPDISIQQQ